MSKISTLFRFGSLVLLASFVSGNNLMAQDEKFKVVVLPVENGSITLNPPLPADSMYAAGTQLTISVTPANGFSLDGLNYANPSARGMFGSPLNEIFVSPYTILVDQNKRVGASFIEAEKLNGFKVIHDVVYAKPGVKTLKYDVFSPDNANNLPIVVIVHGGGWRANTEDIMRGLARELVRDGKYVVCSIDYRWLGDADGDATPNSMANLIEDVYGAIAHIQEHASEYGGDASRIAMTGDSAGGHLSAAATNLVNRIGNGGFGVKDGVYEYRPTYMPAHKTVAQVRQEITAAIQVAAPSYGIFSSERLGGIAGGDDYPKAAAEAIAPKSNISSASERPVPQYLTRGVNDRLIPHENVQAYADALAAAGQTVVYDQIDDVGHAFFDWKPDARTKATFARFGIPYAAKMETFFDDVFYKE